MGVADPLTDGLYDREWFELMRPTTPAEAECLEWCRRANLLGAYVPTQKEFIRVAKEIQDDDNFAAETHVGTAIDQVLKRLT